MTQDLTRPFREEKLVPTTFLPSGSGCMDTYAAGRAQLPTILPAARSATSFNLPMSSPSTNVRISGLNQLTNDPSHQQCGLASNFTPSTRSNVVYRSLLDADSPYPPQYQPPTPRQFQPPFASYKRLLHFKKSSWNCCTVSTPPRIRRVQRRQTEWV